MKIITMYQPWAAFVALEWKTIETRLHSRFVCLVHQTIGIQAAAKSDKDWEKVAKQFLSEEQLFILRAALIPDPSGKYFPIFSARQSIICTVHVDEFRKLTSRNSEQALIDCSQDNRYGLFLSKSHILTPFISTKGIKHRGLWNYPLEEELKIREKVFVV
jgi:hypothetical protein